MPHTLQYPHWVGIEKDELLKECGCCDPSSPATQLMESNDDRYATSYPTFESLQNHFRLSIQYMFRGHEKGQLLV
jgi:hypothetical protein